MIRHLQDGAIDLAVWEPPQRIRVAPDGEQIIEKIPSMPSVKMINPKGHIVFVAVANGMAKQARNDPYRLYKMEEKTQMGFVPYGKCPKAEGLHDFVPDNLKASPPCKVAADGHMVGNEHPCACVVEILKLRRAKNDKAMEELEERHRSRQMRETDQRERQIDAQSHATEKLTELIEKLATTKGGK